MKEPEGEVPGDGTAKKAAILGLLQVWDNEDDSTHANNENEAARASYEGRAPQCDWSIYKRQERANALRHIIDPQ